jgi:hypothetical protein
MWLSVFRSVCQCMRVSVWLYEGVFCCVYVYVACSYVYVGVDSYVSGGTGGCMCLSVSVNVCVHRFGCAFAGCARVSFVRLVPISWFDSRWKASTSDRPSASERR